MIFRSKHDSRGGDDWIIAIVRRKDELDEHAEASWHPMEARCNSKSKEKTAEGDEDDQWTRLIER